MQQEERKGILRLVFYNSTESKEIGMNASAAQGNRSGKPPSFMSIDVHNMAQVFDTRQR